MRLRKCCICICICFCNLFVFVFVFVFIFIYIIYNIVLGASWGEPLASFPESGWDKIMNLNVKSPFFLIQALLPLLTNAATSTDPARIINVGSVVGESAQAAPTYSCHTHIHDICIPCRSAAKYHTLAFTVCCWLCIDPCDMYERYMLHFMLYYDR